MDKNSTIGFVLIAIILVAFFFINKPSADQIAEQARIRDSLAYRQRLEAEVNKVSEELQKQDTISAEPIRNEEYVIIENNVLCLTLTNKGGRIDKAELKNYHRYGDTIHALCLFAGDEQQLNYTFVTKDNHRIETNKTFFDIVPTNDPQKGILRLSLAEDAWLDFVYTLKEGDYMVSFEIIPHNTQQALAQNINFLPIEWGQKIPQQERGRKFEERYAQLQYMFSENDMEKLSETKPIRKKESGHIKWIAYKDQFFSTVCIANEAFQNPILESQPLDEYSGYIKHYHTTTEVAFDPTGAKKTAFRYYLGPNHYNTLKVYDKDVPNNEKLYLKELVPLGWKIVSWINKILVIPMFDLLTSWKLHIGWIIFIMTFVIKLIILPFVFSSYKSSAKMRVLQPQIQAINDKYPAEKMQECQQATMALYNRAGVSPMSGCLPMLFQFPIIMAMFWFFPTAIELRGKSFLWAEDLSTYDAILTWNVHVPLLGDHLSLFCLLMTVVNIAYTYINMQNQSMGNEMKFMKWMMYLMPLMFLFIFNDYAAGLSYYYFVSLLITILQTLFFRWSIDDAKLLAQMEANAQKKGSQKKSGFMAKLEAMQREQQRQIRENAKQNAKRNR